MKSLSKETVNWLELDEASEGQRVDNFLLRVLKGVPKSHVYRILRSGEVRVNSKRVQPTDRLHTGDRVRVPPISISPAAAKPAPGAPLLAGETIFEDDALLVIAKPAGVAVHGGSGIAFGVIERLRAQRPELRFLELVHRLDKDTSGVLLLAKKRTALVGLHEQIREGHTGKRYLTLVHGAWHNAKQTVKLALERHVLASGDRRVAVSDEGKASITTFRKERVVGAFTLLEAELRTGRTHQIRVHLSHLGFPIAGDDKYGDFTLNKKLAPQGLKRMFLHARKFECVHPTTGAKLVFEAPLAADLQAFLDRLAAAPTREPVH